MLIQGKHVFRKFSTQMNLHIPCSLKFLVNHLVHFEPVSTKAVAIIVKLPPLQYFSRPYKRLGRCRALASTPPVSTLPDKGTGVKLGQGT